MKNFFRIQFLILVMALMSSLSGCIFDFGSGSSSEGSANLSVEAANTIGPTGGTVTVPAGSPIAGTIVTVPAGALSAGESVTINISYADQLPLAIDPSVQASGKIIVLTTNDPAGTQFLVPVTVTMPYDPATGVPSVLYFNSASQMYESIAVLEIDATNKLITFETSHFSEYGAFSSKRSMVSATGGLEDDLIEACKGSGTPKNCFTSATDGFFHPNFGSYTTPGGSAFGMAAYASWYFNTKINASSVPAALFYNKYREGNLASADDDVIARQLISRIYGATSKAWGQWSSVSDAYLDAKWKMTQRQVAQQLINTLKITGAPQILMLRGTQAGGSTSHAVVVYKYDGTASPKRFYIYDPNFPGAEVTLDYDPAATDASLVLKSYSKLGASFSTITRYAFGSVSSGIDPKRFESFYNGAEAGWTGAQFASIAVAAPAVDVQGKYPFVTPTNTDTAYINAVVAGTITPATGQPMPKFLIVLLDGLAASVGTDGVVPVGADGSYSLTFPSLSIGNHSLQLFATDSQSAALRFSGFGGSKEVTLKVTTPSGTQFFQNAGFETGDTTGWTVESHTWQTRIAGSFTPGKSVIANLTDGADPIATNIQRVYKGGHSLRVNNSDNNYHISSASQTVTVPGSGAPEVRFYWAAVLQDPSHSPSQQPYVLITVCDLDGDATSNCDAVKDVNGAVISTSPNSTNSLYFRNYFANDPSYPGWLTYPDPNNGSAWTAIDWQTVIIPVAGRPGHHILITAEAADCAQGGHGGYVYIDGDE